MKKFKTAKITFGGKILQRISELLKDKTENGFEIITLVKGLVNANWVTMLQLKYIRVEEDGDHLTLHYPSQKLNKAEFLSYIEKYTLEDKGKMIQLILEQEEGITFLESKYRLVIFSKGKEISAISKVS